MIKTVQDNFGNLKKNDLLEKSIIDISLVTISYKEKNRIIDTINIKIICKNVNNGDILKTFIHTIKPENYNKEYNFFQINENFLSVPEFQIKNIKFDININLTYHEDKTKSLISGDIVTSSFIYSKKIKQKNNIYKCIVSKNIKLDFSFNLNTQVNNTNKISINGSNSNETTNSSNNLKDIQNNQIIKLQSEEMSFSDLPSFCDAFYIASIPIKNAILLDKRLDSKFSQCNHKNCSLLPSYNSDIIFKYPFKDKSPNNFSLTELFSTLSFPFGIKICLENGTSNQNDFFFVSTNQLNEQNYIYVHFTYLKMKFDEFKIKYKIDPVKEFLNINIENNVSDLNEKFILGQKLILTEYVYIPLAYCLVSKFPYQNEMKRCIDSIIKIQDDQNKLNLFLKNIIYEIPNINLYNKTQMKLIFYLPKQINPIIIDNKFYNKGLIIPNNTMKLLFEYFTIENIFKVFKMLLGKHKILFVCNGKDEYNNMSLIQLSFLNLLYPLRWKFTFIPNLSFNMLKFIQSFMPFIMGIDINLLDYAKREYMEEDNPINILYLKKNRKSYFEMDYTINFEELPKSYYSKIRNSLSNIRKVIEKNDDIKINYDSKIRKCFLNIFLTIFGDYDRYTTVIDNIAYFNKSTFLKKKNINNLKFDEAIIDTEMFNDFIQRNCLRSNYEMKDNYFNKLALGNLTNNNNNIKNKRPSSYEKFIEKKLTTIQSDSINNNNSLDGTLYEVNISENNTSPNNNVDKKNTLNLSILNNINNTNRNNNNNFNNIFLIPPYFLQHSILFNDLNKIDELIKEFYSNDKDNENNILSVQSIPNIIDDDNEKIFRYQLPYDIVIKYKKKFEKIKTLSSYGNMFDDKIIELEDMMREILTSKIDEKTENLYLEKIDLKTNKIRNHFCSIIFQEKFNTLNNNILAENTFVFIYKLIFNALLYVTTTSKDDLRNGYLITKSLFHYYKIGSNHKNIFLFEMFNHQSPFDIWLNNDFWEFYLNEEMKKFENPNEDDYFMIILEIGTIMNDLNINARYQITILIDFICEKYIGNKELIKEIENVILKQYNNKKIDEANA